MDKTNLLFEYKNGNYNVSIYDDGTKVRENNLDFFEADFPENIDLKITNYCTIGCLMCHEKSTPEGKHGDIMNEKFIKSLRRGTELAIGGGSVTSHPQLYEFLCKIKSLGIIANITVNQIELQNNWRLVKKLVDDELVYGIGVSYHNNDSVFWSGVRGLSKNIVVHLINGVHGKDVFDFLSEITRSTRPFKVLILGYKKYGRGTSFYETMSERIENNMNWLSDGLNEIMPMFDVISFDNLAIKQLKPERFFTKSVWEEMYMGDDGQHTMYIDLVNREFAMNSTSCVRFMLEDNIDNMFETVKSISKLLKQKEN